MTARTIVGGRPGERGEGEAVPRGIEVLLRKARVDEEFRESLREDPFAAADSIGLVLSPAEFAILAAVAREELLRMADRVEVAEAHRRVFLGTVAAAMLAVLAGGSVMGLKGPSPARPPSVENEPLGWTVGQIVTYFGHSLTSCDPEACDDPDCRRVHRDEPLTVRFSSPESEEE